MPRLKRTTWSDASVAIAIALFILTNVVLFVSPLYRSIVAPDSTAGSFERAIARVRADSRDPSRDVLVLGDSRIFNGFDAARADRAAPALRFVNAGVPGTTPRCWTVFDRAIDPSADRYRAVVIPVDTYGDDDSAIGSIDGDNRPNDLRYIALRASLADDLAIAQSFSPEFRPNALADLVLRGPLLRDDLQDFFAHPAARIAVLTHAARFDEPKARLESLAGLEIFFDPDRFDGTPLAPGTEEAMSRQVFAIPQPSASYARYRREWLGAIVERYARRGVPVVFVRIPTRPAHRSLPGRPSGTIVEFARNAGALVLPQAPYVALEKPELFADPDHLDALGRERMSARLGADVARALRPGETFARIAAPSPISTHTGVPAASAASLSALSPRERLHAARAALGIGTPIRFQSFEFAAFFAIVVAFCTLVRHRRSRTIFLVLASWYVYARWNAWYFAVLLGLTTTDFVFGLLIDASSGARRRAYLTLGVAANLAFLGTAKYADFFTATLARAFGIANDPWALHVLVPVGISFHTFQSISYLVDVARRKTAVVRDPVDYALYIAFFPQLLAGPIVRAGVFFGELYANVRPARAAVVRGLGEIALGLLKKSAIADRFAPVADAYFGNVAAHPGAAAAWSATIAFAFQIYFDFSGYSDIAIGCARVLGFDFPENFRRPYLAWSITEFWRRWHMTLSAWLRDYLYIPLGGNRFGAFFTYRNLLLTMLLGGLWHGANWTFVFWGGYHGVLLGLERALGIGRTGAGEAPRGVRRLVATVVTVGLVLVGWVFFRAPDFATAGEIVRALLLGGSGPGLIDRGQIAIAALAIGIEIAIEVRPSATTTARPLARIALATATLLALELATYPGEAAQFVYFKF